MRFVVIGVLLFATAISGVFWAGYVGSVLWGWFIVPTFAVRPLSVIEATGVTLAVKFFSHVPTISKVNESDEKSLMGQVAESVSVVVFGPAIALLFGWFVRLFM